MASEADTTRHAERILAVFEQQNEDGTYVFSDEDVRHFLPTLLLSAGGALDAAALGVDAGLLLGELAHKAGITAAMTAAEKQQRIDAHYQAHPLNAELVAAMQALLRELSGESVASTAKGLASFTGDKAAVTAPVAGAARPSGTVPGGPLGRFGADAALKKKSP